MPIITYYSQTDTRQLSQKNLTKHTTEVSVKSSSAGKLSAGIETLVHRSKAFLLLEKI